MENNIIQFARRNKVIINDCFNYKLYVNDFSILKKHQKNALVFASIETPLELCRFLKTHITEVNEIINSPEYIQFSIPKKKSGHREIFAPGKRLKSLQKHLNYFLQAYYLCIKPKEVYGFVMNPHFKGSYCNIVENAKMHLQKKSVLNIDLKDFFPSISASQVKALFLSDRFQFNEQVATALTLLTTYQGKLPIGAPTSPVISNFICEHLDKDLIAFCETHELSYTRYADDLTFSSYREITNDHLLDIINIIQKNKFRINERKIRMRHSGKKQVVTGLIVNEKVNIDRKLIKRIRAMIHDKQTNGIEMAARKHYGLTKEADIKYQIKFIQYLNGYINFIGQVRGKDDSLYIKYKSMI